MKEFVVIGGREGTFYRAFLYRRAIRSENVVAETAPYWDRAACVRAAHRAFRRTWDRNGRVTGGTPWKR